MLGQTVVNGITNGREDERGWSVPEHHRERSFKVLRNKAFPEQLLAVPRRQFRANAQASHLLSDLLLEWERGIISGPMSDVLFCSRFESGLSVCNSREVLFVLLLIPNASDT